MSESSTGGGGTITIRRKSSVRAPQPITANLNGNVPTEIRLRKKSVAASPPTLQSNASHPSPKPQQQNPDQAIHSAQDSLFSSSSGYTNYRGFLNLAILLLVLSNARVALENILKYGVLINPGQWINWLVSEQRRYIVFLGQVVSLNMYALIAFILEKRASQGKHTTRFGYAVHTLNIVCLLTIPAVVSLTTNLSPFSSSGLLGLVSVLSLKLISYAQVNAWCRADREAAEAAKTKNAKSVVITDFRKEPKQPLVQYPANLTLSNFYYYLVAPTLCYELNFPRSPRIRKWFVAKRLAECLFLSQVILALGQQWIIPLLNNSQKPFIEMNYGRITERAMKLAIPNHAIWLMFFYLLFHSFLNLLAELLRFADREFYRDWWNAEGISYFWQAWNIPVHRWCLRHLYKPMLRVKYRKFSASVAVFFVSAFFHEYLVSVPLSMFRLWAFLLALFCSALITGFLLRHAGPDSAQLSDGDADPWENGQFDRVVIVDFGPATGHPHLLNVWSFARIRCSSSDIASGRVYPPFRFCFILIIMIQVGKMLHSKQKVAW